MNQPPRMSTVEQRSRLEKLGIPRHISSKMTEDQAEASIAKQIRRRSERRQKAAANRKKAADPGEKAKQILGKMVAPVAVPKPTETDGDENDRLCTKRRDRVPQMVKALVLLLEVETGKHVFGHEVIRDAIAEALRKAKTRAARRLAEEMKSQLPEEPT